MNEEQFNNLTDEEKIERAKEEKPYSKRRPLAIIFEPMHKLLDGIQSVIEGVVFSTNQTGNSLRFIAGLICSLLCITSILWLCGFTLQPANRSASLDDADQQSSLVSSNQGEDPAAVAALAPNTEANLTPEQMREKLVQELESLDSKLASKAKKADISVYGTPRTVTRKVPVSTPEPKDTSLSKPEFDYLAAFGVKKPSEQTSAPITTPAPQPRGLTPPQNGSTGASQASTSPFGSGTTTSQYTPQQKQAGEYVPDRSFSKKHQLGTKSALKIKPLKSSDNETPNPEQPATTPLPNASDSQVDVVQADVAPTIKTPIANTIKTPSVELKEGESDPFPELATNVKVVQPPADSAVEAPKSIEMETTPVAPKENNAKNSNSTTVATQPLTNDSDLQSALEVEQLREFFLYLHGLGI